jgi:hypothetical protein
LNSQGQCQDCDLEPYTKCKSCGEENGSVVCNECASGYRLNDGVCSECSDDGLCLKCKDSAPYDCLECIEGTRLQNGKCIPCSDTLHHCQKCSSPDRCEVCDYNVAVLDIMTAKCSTCRNENNWFKNTTTGACSCNFYTNTLDGNKCQTCQDLIPGCNKCE